MAEAPDSRFGLLGRKLGHSWSPRIHKMLGSAPYALFEREPEELKDFIRHGTWQGLNVTIPYKVNAFALADEVSERAQRIGTANTLIKRRDGSIFADNSDVGGFAWMLKRFCKHHWGTNGVQLLSDLPVVVLGSGGASQAVQAALKELEASVSVISRHSDDSYDTLDTRHADAELLINTTPVGMYPNCPASPLSNTTLARLSHLRGVIDIVYNPARTGLCLQAERLGIPFESGLAMLVAQAALSSELFLSTTHSQKTIEMIERELRSSMTNICLIGMPGVGKTSTGALLARKLHRPFIDLDAAFEIKEDSTAAGFISAHGEAAFRDAESQILADYASRSGLVISCGGGVVVRKENYDLLHQNGLIVMLDRPIEQLSTRGRPLSQSKGLVQLAAERMNLYRSWADIIVACTGSPAGDAHAISDFLKTQTTE
ncbi:shikimate kinase [uncultured Olegusella sp.]|uniref:shikimate kinase n=1 Tax=uncultured Olegusella sp. TaxID=1979846 RepID=UPI002602C92B|nr:shikimate kinase [uncultured Olegusella sp.]